MLDFTGGELSQKSVFANDSEDWLGWALDLHATDCGQIGNDGAAKRDLRSALGDFSRAMGFEPYLPLNTFDAARLLDIHATYGNEFAGGFQDQKLYDLSQQLGEYSCTPLASPPDMYAWSFRDRVNHRSCSVDGNS